jgi:hypothetical protein
MIVWVVTQCSDVVSENLTTSNFRVRRVDTAEEVLAGGLQAKIVIMAFS